jgi:3-phenylpropionate/trans-cinnamate dioxygenase ferredoxin subunit
MSMQRVCALSDIGHGEARRVQVGNAFVALVRIDDNVYAIGDRCSHANVSLSDGEVHCDTKELECVRHGSAFSLETGIPNTLPATQPVAVYVAEVRNGDVYVGTETKGASKHDGRGA